MAGSDPCAVYGLKSGSKRRRKGEDPKSFLARIVKTAPKVFAQVEGDLPASALVFGIDLSMMEDILSANRKGLGQHLTKARAIAAARNNQTAELADEARKALVAEVSDKDKRLKRKSWPVDVDQRRSDIHDALCVSLVENEGDISETSTCLNVAIDEINDMMEGDEYLQASRLKGLQVQATRAESQLFMMSKQGNFQAAKMVLTNLLGDQWSERQQVDIRRVGFAPPDEKETEIASVLQFVKGDKGNA